ncbi:catalase HPII [soil metagenome]
MPVQLNYLPKHFCCVIHPCTLISTTVRKLYNLNHFRCLVISLKVFIRLIINYLTINFLYWNKLCSTTRSLINTLNLRYMNKKAADVNKHDDANAKQQDLERDKETGRDQFLTSNQGLRINDDQNSLLAGERGATLLEDFLLREKITHFDHERIPERIVHARGSAAHGYFEVYDDSMTQYTKAKFLTDANRRTPVFVRFSTVAGFRGSTDLARDVRGFAVKFYTEEGNYDLVGNNIPVFFIQDGIKFPDLVHAVKPEQDNGMPQAASAHDTFWDFISLMPESMHMIMWAMSDRAIPRSYRMMEGFGVHTFRFINEAGESTFVKFHWKPLLGVHSVAWDEAQKISGFDADFHRRDLWEAIEQGQFPEWEFGVQLVPQADEHKFDFDLLDPTKLIPEELVPVQRIGKMVLNRNPDNFHAETEQVAFHPGHVVSGIDFTNDPLLQGRLFSYTDTQLIRLGGPNFHEIPINRPIAPVHNNQREGVQRHTINKGKASYHPNSIGGGCPYQAMMSEGGFNSFNERIDGNKIRNRSKSFLDHFSQAKLFLNSQSEAERKHLTDALRFELGKLKMESIQLRTLGLLDQIDSQLAADVADSLGLEVPTKTGQMNHSVPADAKLKDYESIVREPDTKESAALSMANTAKNTIATRRIGILVANGVDGTAVDAMMKTLQNQGAMVKVIAKKLGTVTASKGKDVNANMTFLTSASVLFDALYVPGGAESAAALKKNGDAIHFINEAYKHCKPIATDNEGVEVLKASSLGLLLEAENINNMELATDLGIVIGASDDVHRDAFIRAIAQHRFWNREMKEQVPA